MRHINHKSEWVNCYVFSGYLRKFDKLVSVDSVRGTVLVQDIETNVKRGHCTAFDTVSDYIFEVTETQVKCIQSPKRANADTINFLQGKLAKMLDK